MPDPFFHAIEGQAVGNRIDVAHTPREESSIFPAPVEELRCLLLEDRPPFKHGIRDIRYLDNRMVHLRISFREKQLIIGVRLPESRIGLHGTDLDDVRSQADTPLLSAIPRRRVIPF